MVVVSKLPHNLLVSSRRYYVGHTETALPPPICTFQHLPGKFFDPVAHCLATSSEHPTPPGPGLSSNSSPIHRGWLVCPSHRGSPTGSFSHVPPEESSAPVL